MCVRKYASSYHLAILLAVRLDLAFECGCWRNAHLFLSKRVCRVVYVLVDMSFSQSLSRSTAQTHWHSPRKVHAQTHTHALAHQRAIETCSHLERLERRHYGWMVAMWHFLCIYLFLSSLRLFPFRFTEFHSIWRCVHNEIYSTSKSSTFFPFFLPCFALLSFRFFGHPLCARIDAVHHF